KYFAGGQSGDPRALLCGLWFGGGEPALLSSVVAVVGPPAAQPQGRRHAGFGFHAPAARRWPAGGRGGGLHQTGTQALPASAFGGAGGGAPGGATMVATGQRRLREQRGGFFSGSMGEPAPPHSVARWAGRLGLLSAGLAGVVGAVAPALRGGGATEPTHPAPAAGRSGLDENPSAGNGSGRGDVSGHELAAATAPGVAPPSGGGKGSGRRQETN